MSSSATASSYCFVLALAAILIQGIAGFPTLAGGVVAPQEDVAPVDHDIFHHGMVVLPTVEQSDSESQFRMLPVSSDDGVDDQDWGSPVPANENPVITAADQSEGSNRQKRFLFGIGFGGGHHHHHDDHHHHHGHYDGHHHHHHDYHHHY